MKLWKNRPVLVSREKYKELVVLRNNYNELLLKNRVVLGDKDLKRVIKNKHLYLDEEPIFVNCMLIDCVIKNRSEDGISVHGIGSTVYGNIFTTAHKFKVPKGTAINVKV